MLEKVVFFIIRLYFKIVSVLAPQLAARQATTLFQRPKKRAYKTNEVDFYNKAKHFKVDYSEESLDAYELGSENKKMVLLVHGWGSNIGRLSNIAFRLEAEGYRVVGMNFPAHGNSKLNQTNMLYSRDALKALLNQLQIQESFSLVSHSFGSGVSAFTLADLGLEVDKLVFLTSANRIEDIFLDFKKMVSLGDKAYRIMVEKLEKTALLKLEELNIQDVLKAVEYKKLLIIHDKYDKMLPYSYATEIAENAPNVELMTIENKGHSGMLFDETVINKVVSFID